MRVTSIGAPDVERLARLHALAFDEAWTADDFHSLLSTPGVFALLAKGCDGADVGLVLMRTAADEAEVLTLAVAPARRRQGFAHALLTAAYAAAADLGAQTVFLEVAVDNDAAARLYDGMGFTPIGRRPKYYRRGSGWTDAVVLRRNLNSPSTSLYDGETF